MINKINKGINMAITKQSFATTPVYRGFTTFQRLSPPFTVTDIDCVKQDLLNTFHTHRGSRVMMPTFGSIIQELLFDPFDDITRQLILDDVFAVIDTDPRVELISSDVKETDYGIRIEAVLQYTPGNTAETLFIDFIRESREAI